MVTPFHLSDGKLRVEARSYGADYFSKEKSRELEPFPRIGRYDRSPFPGPTINLVTMFIARL